MLLSKELIAGVKMRTNRSLLLTVGAALALSLSGLANAGIENTKHNMSSSGTANNIFSTNDAAGTDEICVFCHTPHMNVAKGDVLPLWNHRLTSGNPSYSMYKSASFNGGDLNAGVITLASPSDAATIDAGTSVTNLCLSCHDGTQAVNAMFNPPNRLNNVNPTMTGGDILYGGKAISATSNAYLGTDLSNDHPVNFSYSRAYTGDGGAASGTLFAPTGTASVTGNGNTVRLFADTVQCATCHDPHKDYSVNTEFTPFLRVSIAGSALCLTCHDK